MSLAQIQYPPPVESGLEEWLFCHNQAHKAIITAMREVKGISVPERVIYPVNTKDPASMAVFLREHLQAHQDFQGPLGIPGTDIGNVDFTNAGTRDAFFFTHFLTHYAAAQALGLPIL